MRNFPLLYIVFSALDTLINTCKREISNPIYIKLADSCNKLPMIMIYFSVPIINIRKETTDRVHRIRKLVDFNRLQPHTQ